MVDTAAWLVDAVIPEVPVRQWVLSLPYRVRALCAYDPAACALVRSVLVSAVAGFYERTARRLGVPRARGGAVAFVQRFDSALRLNVHFHVLWLDGVYGWEPGRGQPVFHEHAGLCDGDVELLMQRLRVRVLRALRKLGTWVDAEDAADRGDEVGDELLPGLVAAAIKGRAALGERAGQRDGRVGQDRSGQQVPRGKGPLCADSGGFSLHAGAWVAARDRERLEKLCRYAAVRRWPSRGWWSSVGAGSGTRCRAQRLQRVGHGGADGSRGTREPALPSSTLDRADLQFRIGHEGIDRQRRKSRTTSSAGRPWPARACCHAFPRASSRRVRLAAPRS
jgi:hypothetical protein